MKIFELIILKLRFETIINFCNKVDWSVLNIYLWAIPGLDRCKIIHDHSHCNTSNNTCLPNIQGYNFAFASIGKQIEVSPWQRWNLFIKLLVWNVKLNHKIDG